MITDNEDKMYKLPSKVLTTIYTTRIANPKADGVDRANNLLHDKSVKYGELKRLKNFFDAEHPNQIQYNLAGGKYMRNFVEETLAQVRNANDVSTERRQEITVDTNTAEHPYNANPDMSLNEAKKKKKELQKNAVAVIVNNDNKILLLKRGEDAPWMPNKWALVGGVIEKGEAPEKACKREIKEETGLDVKNFVKSFTIQRHAESIEHLFACRFVGEPTNIELDKSENTNYGWYDVNEMEFLDTVPHLVEYITLVFVPYE